MARHFLRERSHDRSNRCTANAGDMASDHTCNAHIGFLVLYRSSATYGTQSRHQLCERRSCKQWLLQLLNDHDAVSISIFRPPSSNIRISSSTPAQTYSLEPLVTQATRLLLGYTTRPHLNIDWQKLDLEPCRQQAPRCCQA